MKINKYYWLALIPAILIVASVMAFSETPIANAMEVTVYKSPTCGCCVNYIALLEKRGYTVKVVKTDNMSGIKRQYNIEANMESCHTSIFDNYVVEGHVPFEAIDRLLAEKPDIRGIALPNMPAGSPGMPGFKQGLFKIYSLTESGTDIFSEE